MTNNNFSALNTTEKLRGNYYLDEDSISELGKYVDSEIIRFPTTFNNGLMKPFSIISDGRVVTGHTLNSCYAGFMPNNIDELIRHIKSFNLNVVGAHGINGDLLPVNESIYHIIGSFTKMLSESLVTICVSIWNVTVLELMDYLHPSRKIEGVNFAIMVTDDFKQAVNNNTDFKLYNATRQQVIDQTLDPIHFVRHINAVELYNRLCRCIQIANISVINIDRMNARNMNKHLGKAISTNICTEILPVGNFACTLGSINLHMCVKNGLFDWDVFEKGISLIVKTLNVAINVSMFSTQKDIQYYNQKVLRPIAIGVTGYANCLIDQNICYEESEQFAYELFSRMLATAIETSMAIGQQRPEMIPDKWHESEWANGKLPIDMWTDSELARVTYTKIPSIESRLSKLREDLKVIPMVNCNLIGHMPTLRRGLTKNMCLSLTPLHSLVTEFGTETGRVLYTVRGLPSNLEAEAHRRQGIWSPMFGDVYKTSEFMDLSKILNIYYIAQQFCDMNISITPHFNTNSINTIHTFISKSYNLNTPLYYMRLDIRSNVIANSNDGDKCKNGFCQV